MKLQVTNAEVVLFTTMASDEAKKDSASLTFWFTAFCISSVGMTIGNKFANTAIDHGDFQGTDKAVFKATLFVRMHCCCLTCAP